MHFQIICFCVLQNKESLLQVWNDMSASFHFWVNYTFKFMHVITSLMMKTAAMKGWSSNAFV